MIFDTDAHIMESEETFAALADDPEWKDLSPRVVHDLPSDVGGLRPFWIIESTILPNVQGQGVAAGFGTPNKPGVTQYAEIPMESATLTSVAARLADMDRYELDVSVNFPTIFLTYPVAQNPGLLKALVRTYNDWFAGKCEGTNGRLRWVAPLPWPDVQGAIDEMRRVKQLGAAGVMLLGTVGEMLLDDDRLFPFYQAAQDLHMPLCVHIGWGYPPLRAPYTSYGPGRMQSQFIPFYVPVHMAFSSFVIGGILERFPRLRVAFLEAGIAWLSYWLELMERGVSETRIQRLIYPSASGGRRIADYFKRGNLFISTELDERGLPGLIEEIGDDALMYSSDLPHAHRVVDGIKLFNNRPDIPAVAKEKILGPNGQRFFEEPL